MGFSDFSPKSVNVPHAKLDSLGADGWELTDVYTTVETVHPNFGNAQYVTGLQPNTRTAEVYYVFKRPVVAGDTTKSQPVEYANIEIKLAAEPVDSAAC